MTAALIPPLLALAAVLGVAAIVAVRSGAHAADMLEEPIENIPDPKAFREERAERWGTHAVAEDSE